MASACVKNASFSPDKFSTYGWSSPIMSLKEQQSPLPPPPPPPLSEPQDPVTDFEFCLEDPVTMLSADELFSDGKLVPLKFSGESGPNPNPKPTTTTTTATESLPEVPKTCRRLEMEISDLFSPKAPRCTTRWRELLGLKKLANTKQESSVSSSPNPKTLSFKTFLHRGSKASSQQQQNDASSPLLKDSEASESSISISSSRLSLSSSSSSSHEIDDVPRLSLDLDNNNNTKPSPNPFAPSRTHLRTNPNQPRIRLAKPRTDGSLQSSSSSTVNESRGVTVTADSPRLNASGKLVFHGLERSSSSPGSFTGGPRMKQSHGMPRSYSANVRVTNVPVCSIKSGLFFGQLFSSSSSSSSSASSSSSSSPSPGNKTQLQSNNYNKNRTNRTRLEPKFEG